MEVILYYGGNMKCPKKHVKEKLTMEFIIFVEVPK